MSVENLKPLTHQVFQYLTKGRRKQKSVYLSRGVSLGFRHGRSRDVEAQIDFFRKLEGINSTCTVVLN